jgi:hypothetical protein
MPDHRGGTAIPLQPTRPCGVLFGGRHLLSGAAATAVRRRGYQEGLWRSCPARARFERAVFGDVRLHSGGQPFLPERTGSRQRRGVLQGRYEVQVLDSYANVTYPDGQAAAVYGQYPPLWIPAARRENGRATTSCSAARDSATPVSCSARPE